MKTVIAGGGLAGLTCAKTLLDAGVEVVVIESESFLGGRASTYRDDDGDWVEQGLHLFTGSYTEFQRLLRELDRENAIAWMDELRLKDTDGPAEATLGLDPLRSPLKTMRGMLADNDYLGLRDKIGLLPLALPGFRGYQHLRDRYDGMTVADWWRKVSNNERIMTRFIRPFCRSIQFTEPEQFSAFNFFGWIHNTIKHPGNTRLAGYRGARDETIFTPLAEYLTSRGATILTRTAVDWIDFTGVADDVRVRSFSVGGDDVEADLFVAAMPVWCFRPLLPSWVREMPFFERLEVMAACPALSVQLWFDRDVIGSSSFTLLANSHVSVYQDQRETAYPQPGTRLSAVVSPAEERLAWADEEIVREVLVDLARVEPAISTATVRKALVLRHQQHLVRPHPGVMSLRPSNRTPVHNLWLAGDWTDQPYFGSQEGAVRSGRMAARDILEHLGRQTARSAA